MNLKETGKVFTSKFVGTGPSSYKIRIYRAAVSQRLRNTALWDFMACIEANRIANAVMLNSRDCILSVYFLDYAVCVLVIDTL